MKARYATVEAILKIDTYAAACSALQHLLAVHLLNNSTNMCLEPRPFPQAWRRLAVLRLWINDE